MEIFGIGPLELLLVFVLALIFVGPGKMPELAASLGKMLREFRAASAELTDALNAEIAEAERRKTAVAENGNGHSPADAVAQAEIVAQGAIDAPPAIEFTSPEVINYQYEAPPQPPPEPVTTIDDVLNAIAQQEAEEAAKREAEEKARLDAIALERAIRNGVGPLPESLLRPSTDAPMIVVNPTEQPKPEPAIAEAVESTDLVTEGAESPVSSDAVAEEVESGVTSDAVPVAEPVGAETPSPSANGEVHDEARAVEPDVSDEKLAEAEGESLETAGARQAEVQ